MLGIASFRTLIADAIISVTRRYDYKNHNWICIGLLRLERGSRSLRLGADHGLDRANMRFSSWFAQHDDDLYQIQLLTLNGSALPLTYTKRSALTNRRLYCRHNTTSISIRRMYKLVSNVRHGRFPFKYSSASIEWLIDMIKLRHTINLCVALKLSQMLH